MTTSGSRRVGIGRSIGGLVTVAALGLGTVVVPVGGALAVTSPSGRAFQAPTASDGRPFAGIRTVDPDTGRTVRDHRPFSDEPRAPASVTDGPRWTVVLRATDRLGLPASDGQSSYSVVDLANGMQVAWGRFVEGVTAELPAGRYAVRTMVVTSASGSRPSSRTLVLVPELALGTPPADGAAAGVQVDARTGVPVAVDLDEPKAVQVSALVTVLQRAGDGRLVRHEMGAESFEPARFFVAPTGSRTDLTTYVETVWTRPDRPDVYNAVHSVVGRVPDRLRYQVRVGAMAAVWTTYAAQGDVEACGGTYIGAVLQGRPSSVSYGTTFPLPTRRTEYYLPSPDVSWYTQFAQTDRDCTFERMDFQTGPVRTYRQPGVYRAAWNTAPLAPAVVDSDGVPVATREGDTVRVRVPLFADSQEGHADFGGPYDGATGDVALSADGVRLCGSETLEAFECVLPSEGRTYRLTATANRHVPWSVLTTGTATTWTFRSSRTGGTDGLPLIGVRYDLRLDDRNRATAGRPAALSVRTTAGVVRATLSISVNGGKQWQPVPLRRVDDHWQAMYLQPAEGAVSLRFEAADGDGNTVTQVIGDAYLIS